MPSQILATTVVKVLGRPELSRINFRLNGLLVAWRHYAIVRQAVYASVLTCKVGVPQRDGLPAGSFVEARYVPELNQFQFPREGYGQDVGSEKLRIVHEATHASFDVVSSKSGRKQLAIDDEACACLAEKLMERLTPWTSGGATIIGDAEDEAGKLADRIVAETNDLTRVRGAYVVQPAASRALRDAVASRWGFLEGKRGIQYVYDGLER